MNHRKQRRMAFRGQRWILSVLLAASGAGTASAQIWECATAGGSAQCPQPDTSDFACVGTFSISDSQPCKGLYATQGKHCRDEDEAIEQAIDNYLKVFPNTCARPTYGPLCPAVWNPEAFTYYLGVLQSVRRAYVAKVPSLIEGQCMFPTDNQCGNPDVPNHFYGAIGVCQRKVSCPPGSAEYNGVCKTFKSEVCQLGNPMDCVTGEKTQVENDIRRTDSSPIEFTRYYASTGFYEPRGSGPQQPADRHHRILGPNWRHSYQRAIWAEPLVSGQPAMMTVMHPDGDYRHFRLIGGQWLGRKDKSETLQELTDQGQRTGWRYLGEDNRIEIYAADGRLLSISYTTGQILTFDYSTPSTPAAIAPFDGLLIGVADSTGRVLSFHYDALARIARIVDPAGAEFAYAYSSEHALTGVTRPGGATRTYLYNEPAHNLSYYAGTMLTGIIDENGQRYATYRYSHNKVNEEWHGSAYADRLAITYTSGPAPPYYFARSTGALGNFEQRELVAVNGIVKEKGRKRCATSNCSTVISETFQTYDANGSVDQTVDSRGATTDFDFNDRGLETLRREGYAQPMACPATTTFYSSNYGSACVTGTCWKTSPFPGSSSAAPLGWNGWYYSCLQSTGPATRVRTTETDWHATFNIPVERRVRNESDALETRRQWVYNSRGQLSAECEFDVGDTAAMNYACSATTAPPANAAVRRRVYSYCEAADVAATGSTCPVLGYLKSVNGPRSPGEPGMNGLDDVTTYAYFATTDESGCSAVGGVCHRKGDLQTIGDALGLVSEVVAYDRGGRPARTRDANGTITDYTYDGRGFLRAQTIRALASGTPDAQDATTAIVLDAAGQVTRVTRPDGSFFSYLYDDAHRLTDILDSVGNRIHYTLDAAGNRLRESIYDTSYDPAAPGTGLKRAVLQEFNTLGRLVRTLNASSTALRDSSSYDTGGLSDGYDVAGNRVQFKDALNVQTRQSFDPLNRLVKTIEDYSGTDAETANATTEYTYDTRDNLRTYKDPSGLTTTYTRDGLRNLTGIDSPDTGHTGFDYDRAGNTTGMTDNRGVASVFTYDARNRLRRVAYPTSSLDIAYHYDDANLVTGCLESFPLGRLTRMIDSSGTTTYCYDRRGNVVRKTQNTAGTDLTVAYTYTLADRMATVAYPGGGIATYGYDAAGRVVTLDWKENAGAAATAVIAGISYYPFGPAHVLTYGDARTLTRSYDQDYLIDSIVSSASGGLVLDFGRDVKGSITSASASAGAATPDRRYVYDALNRLTRIDTGAGAMLEDFGYDKSGDRLFRQLAGQPSQAYTYVAGTHRLGGVAGVSRSHDANGNTTDRGDGVTLGFDDRNRLVTAATGVNPTSYDYSGRGERVSKTRAGGPAPEVTRYVYDESGALLLQYSDAGSGATSRTVYLRIDGIAVAQVAGSALSYLESDHLGTPRVAAEPATGATQWRWDLLGSGFGDHAAASVVSGKDVALRFPGQLYDAETGLHYNYFRDYDAATGRYLQSDPIGLQGGPSTFAYVGLDPLNFIDPSGLVRIQNCPNCDETMMEQLTQSVNQWCNKLISRKITDVKLRNCVKKRCNNTSIICDKNCPPYRCGSGPNDPNARVTTARGHSKPDDPSKITLCVSEKPAEGGWGSTAVHEFAHTCGTSRGPNWAHGDGLGVPNDPGPDKPSESQCFRVN